MGKYILGTILLLFVTISMQAQQITGTALGVRLGNSSGFGTELSFQQALYNNNRLEIDLGWRDGTKFNALKGTFLLQKVRPIGYSGLNFYYGAGGGVGAFNFEEDFPIQDAEETFYFLSGNIGLEYDFAFPILISIDFRPEVNIKNDLDDTIEYDIAFGVRYQF